MAKAKEMVGGAVDTARPYVERLAQDEELHDAMNVALVVGGSIVIPHLRHAFDTLDQLRREQLDQAATGEIPKQP